MFLIEIKRLISSALEIEFFELYFEQPVLGGHPVLSGHVAIPLIQDRLCFVSILNSCLKKV